MCLLLSLCIYYDLSSMLPCGYFLKHVRLDFYNLVEKLENGFRNDLEDASDVGHLNKIFGQMLKDNLQRTHAVWCLSSKNRLVCFVIVIKC